MPCPRHPNGGVKCAKCMQSGPGGKEGFLDSVARDTAAGRPVQHMFSAEEVENRIRELGLESEEPADPEMDEAIKIMTEMSSFSKLDPKYVKLFRQTWDALCTEGGIPKANVPQFASVMLQEGWKDWAPDDSDAAKLAKLRDPIPLLDFARYAES
eukprot:Hpha_TRINITY_DN34150_c0_g1::TRINITY_DN34150_c0_g1_i1::g.75955::m.75955